MNTRRLCHLPPPDQGSTLRTLAIGLTFITGCRASFDRLEFTEVHMGMPVRIVAYDSSGNAPEAVANAFSAIAALEDIFSDFRPSSEVSLLAQAPPGPVTLSPELFEIFLLSDRLVRASGGAFDPTIAPWSAAWRKARDGRGSNDLMAAVREGVGWEHVHLDTLGHALVITSRAPAFDFGAIAKGYILEQAAARLKEAGIHRFLLEAGGEIVLGCSPPDQAGWFVGIDEAAGRVDTLVNVAIATSGDSQQFVVIDGIRYSHLIDPSTGIPLTDSGAVTVTASSAAVADGAATAIRVGGTRIVPGLLLEFPTLRILKRPGG